MVLSRAIVSYGVELPKKQTFFGRCMQEDGSVVMLRVKAVSEKAASEQLHSGYAITMVIDLLREDEMPKEWAKFKPSLIQRAALV